MDALLSRYRPAQWIALGAFFGVTYGPLMAALASALGEPGVSAMEVLSARRLELLVRSLAFALAVAALTTTVGVLAALAILRRFPAWSARLQWLLLATVALPPTVPALAWNDVFSLLQPLTGFAVAGHWLHAATAQAMALLPFSTGVALLALRTADPQLLDAGRIFASPLRLLLGIAVPLARPTLAAGAALVFLLSLLDYTIPSVFGISVYAMDIFVAFSASHRVADAFWLSLPLTAGALLLVATLARLPRQLAQAANPDFPAGGKLSALAEVALLLALFLAVAALLAPLLSFLPALADPGYLGRTVTASGSEVSYTIMTSSLSAILALLLAVGPAIELTRARHAAGVLQAAILLPFLVPPALTGVGLIALWSPVHAIDIYGTFWMTIAAELARFTPIAVVMLSTWLLRIDPLLVDAALVAGTSLRRIVFLVLLPLAVPGLVAAASIAFVLSLGEIGANLLVTPAGAGTLTMKAYNYLHYGGSQAAAGLCLMLLALVAAAALVAMGTMGTMGTVRQAALPRLVPGRSAH